MQSIKRGGYRGGLVVPTGGSVDDSISKSSKICSLPRRDRGVETVNMLRQSQSSSLALRFPLELNDYMVTIYRHMQHTLVEPSDSS